MTRLAAAHRVRMHTGPRMSEVELLPLVNLQDLALEDRQPWKHVVCKAAATEVRSYAQDGTLLVLALQSRGSQLSMLAREGPPFQPRCTCHLRTYLCMQNISSTLRSRAVWPHLRHPTETRGFPLCRLQESHCHGASFPQSQPPRQE
jgi:hypothetical protein